MPIPTTDELFNMFEDHSVEIKSTIESLANKEYEEVMDDDDIEEFKQYKKVFTWDTEYVVNASYVLHELDVSQIFESADEYQECLEGNTHNTFDEW